VIDYSSTGLAIITIRLSFVQIAEKMNQILGTKPIHVVSDGMLIPLK